MSTLSGNSPRNLQQQRKLAKDLLKAARGGDADAAVRRPEGGRVRDSNAGAAGSVCRAGSTPRAGRRGDP